MLLKLKMSCLKERIKMKKIIKPKTKAIEIVGLDVNELIKLLRTAFADEWSAAFQYWIGAKIVKGQNRTAVAAELLQHFNEELAHANMIADRIIQLGGTPTMYPIEWNKIGGCKYDAIKSENVDPVLTENIKGEQCAIQFYNDLLKKVAGKDFLTYEMVAKILADEVMHEQDLMALQEDLCECK